MPNGIAIKNYDDEIAQLKNDHFFQVRLYINGVYTTLYKCDYYLFGNTVYLQAMDYPGYEGTQYTIASWSMNV